MRERVIQQAPEAPAVVHGLSAFDLAKKAGYRGTLEQWLASLKGEPGGKGGRGLSGKDGLPGRDLVAVDAEALFEKDEDHLTTRMTLVADGGQVLALAIPVRDEDGYMVAARIIAGSSAVSQTALGAT